MKTSIFITPRRGLMGNKPMGAEYMQDVIERCVKLWSNPSDVVLSPFAGIGSEGYQSLLMGRKFVGVELKTSYFNQAVKNLNRAENASEQKTLFDLAEASA